MAITRQTVLILGAGASTPYGFPLGSGLRDKICELLLNPVTRIIVERYGFARELVDGFATAMQHGGYASVDQCLERRPEFLQVGKIAIALVLLPYERHERLFPPKVPSGEHWYELLLAAMSAGTEDWKRNRVAVITFNYDRSFEHYFMTVLGERSRGAKRDIARLLQQIEIVHVHGMLGAYPGLGEGAVSYGAREEEDAILRAAEGIRVVSELSGEEGGFTRASELLGDAEQVCFLGFGFNEQSVRRLRAFDGKFRHWDVAAIDATSKGIPEPEWKRIQREVIPSGLRAERFARSVASFVRERLRLQ